MFSPQSADIARDGVRNAASLQIYALSVVFGPVGGLIWRLVPVRHLEA